MSKTVDFLHKASVFYHASVEGAEARVRPINSVIEYNGKIYFETSNVKDMYRQMCRIPILRFLVWQKGNGSELRVRQLWTNLMRQSV